MLKKYTNNVFSSDSSNISVISDITKSTNCFNLDNSSICEQSLTCVDESSCDKSSVCVDESSNCCDKSSNCCDKSSNCCDKSSNCCDKSSICCDKSSNSCDKSSCETPTISLNSCDCISIDSSISCNKCRKHNKCNKYDKIFNKKYCIYEQPDSRRFHPIDSRKKCLEKKYNVEVTNFINPCFNQNINNNYHPNYCNNNCNNSYNNNSYISNSNSYRNNNWDEASIISANLLYNKYKKYNKYHKL